MATRLFSKDPLSWGQIFFLWVGGLSVLGIPVLGARLMYDEGDTAYFSAGLLKERAERLGQGLAEIRGLRAFLGDLPGAKFSLDSVSVEELIERAVQERSAEPSLLDIEREATLESERRRVADSVSEVRMDEARAEYATAHFLFGATVVLVLISAGGVAFLIWRSFHGAARTESPQSEGYNL